jgi:hypothetical protein
MVLPAKGHTPSHITTIAKKHSAYLITLDMLPIALMIVQKLAHLLPLLAVLQHRAPALRQVLPSLYLGIIAVTTA